MTNQIHAPASIMTDHRGLPSEARHSNIQDGCYGARFNTSTRENPITTEPGKANSLKDEEEEDLDEEDILDGEGENPAQTAAERAAARRKMKRFRSVCFGQPFEQELTAADSLTSKLDFL